MAACTPTTDRLLSTRCEHRDAGGIVTTPSSTVCELCQALAPDKDDIFCVPCRVEITAMCETVHDPIAIVLNHHAHVCFLSDIDKTLCRCGERFDGGPGYHRMHVAEKVYKALGLPGPVPNTPASDEIQP